MTITTNSKNHCAGVSGRLGIFIGGTDGGSYGFISITFDRPSLQFSVATSKACTFNNAATLACSTSRIRSGSADASS
jgi:hypothetical protein